MRSSNVLRCAVIALSVAATASSFAFSQSSPAGARLRLAGNEGAEAPPVALEGYCAVCLKKGHRWVKGNPEHSAVYDGRRYFFPSENEKSAFLKAPSQYAPVLNGDSVVGYAESGQRIPGNIRHATLDGGRLYLFQSEAEKRRFAENPKKYATADLALDGRCAVCRSNGGNVPGKPEFSARNRGIRYWFPTDRQRQEFLARPERYAVQATGRAAIDGPSESCACGSKNCKACNTKPSASAGGIPVQGTEKVAVQGTTTCATCEYGVPPLRAKETLGLAVETKDGKVYIVEDAHRLYPKLYEARFQHVPVELEGKVLQTKGKFVWVQPASVKAVR